MMRNNVKKLPPVGTVIAAFGNTKGDRDFEMRIAPAGRFSVYAKRDKRWVHMGERKSIRAATYFVRELIREGKARKNPKKSKVAERVEWLATEKWNKGTEEINIRLNTDIAVEAFGRAAVDREITKRLAALGRKKSLTANDKKEAATLKKMAGLAKTADARRKKLLDRMAREAAPWKSTLAKYPEIQGVAAMALGAKKPDQVIKKGKFRFVLDSYGKGVVYASKEYTNPTYKDAWIEFRKAQKAVVKKIGETTHIFLEEVGPSSKGEKNELYFGTGS